MKREWFSKLISFASVAGAVVSIVGLLSILQRTVHFKELTLSIMSGALGLLAGLLSSYLADFTKKLRTAPRVFLSYSRENERAATKVAEALRSHGALIWMDVERLKAGDEFQSVIKKAIDDADSFVLLLSDNQGSFWKYELGLARSKGLRIIPVLLQDVPVPGDLKNLQYVDLRKDFSSGMDELVKAAT